MHPPLFQLCPSSEFSCCVVLLELFPFLFKSYCCLRGLLSPSVLLLYNLFSHPCSRYLYSPNNGLLLENCHQCHSFKARVQFLSWLQPSVAPFFGNSVQQPLAEILTPPPPPSNRAFWDKCFLFGMSSLFCLRSGVVAFTVLLRFGKNYHLCRVGLHIHCAEQLHVTQCENIDLHSTWKNKALLVSRSYFPRYIAHICFSPASVIENAGVYSVCYISCARRERNASFMYIKPQSHVC